MFDLETLPPIECRVVVQTWKLIDPPINCTRSIELVDGDFFIVSRCRDSDNKPFGGNEGARLQQISSTSWMGVMNKVLWEVKTDGSLVATQDGVLAFMGLPWRTLWP